MSVGPSKLVDVNSSFRDERRRCVRPPDHASRRATQHRNPSLAVISSSSCFLRLRLRCAASSANVAPMASGESNLYGSVSGYSEGMGCTSAEKQVGSGPGDGDEEALEESNSRRRHPCMSDGGVSWDGAWWPFGVGEGEGGQVKDQSSRIFCASSRLADEEAASRIEAVDEEEALGR